MPSSGCALTRPRARAQTGRNKNNPRLPEIGGYIFAVNLYKLLSKGTRNFPKRQRKKSRMVEGRSLHSVPLAIRLISKPTPRTFQVHTKQNQRIISCFPAWDRMREDWKQKRKQAPEPDGGGACVWILNLSLCPSVNALYHSNIEKNISQYVTINCNFYKCTFKLKALDNTARLNVCYM